MIPVATLTNDEAKSQEYARDRRDCAIDKEHDKEQHDLSKDLGMPKIRRIFEGIEPSPSFPSLFIRQSWSEDESSEKSLSKRICTNQVKSL